MEGAAKKTHSLSSGTVTADQAATLKWMKQIWKAHLCLSFSHFLTVRYHHPNGFIVVWEVCERGTRILLLLLNAVINIATMKMIQPNCVRVFVCVCLCAGQFTSITTTIIETAHSLGVLIGQTAYQCGKCVPFHGEIGDGQQKKKQQQRQRQSLVNLSPHGHIRLEWHRRWSINIWSGQLWCVWKNRLKLTVRSKLELQFSLLWKLKKFTNEPSSSADAVHW